LAQSVTVAVELDCSLGSQGRVLHNYGAVKG